MVDNIFAHTIFRDFILPWILVFVLVFALLDKSQLLGEGKKQINAIIGAVIGFLLLAFETSRDIIINLIPVFVIAAVVLFVFMLLYAFVSGDTKGDPLHKSVKIGFGVLIGIVVLVAVLIITDTWDSVWGYLSSSNTGANILFILIAGAAVIAVLMGGKKKKED